MVVSRTNPSPTSLRDKPVSLINRPLARVAQAGCHQHISGKNLRTGNELTLLSSECRSASRLQNINSSKRRAGKGSKRCKWTSLDIIMVLVKKLRCRLKTEPDSYPMSSAGKKRIKKEK